MSSTDRRSAEEIIAGEAKLARETMAEANPPDPLAYLRSWFIKFGDANPGLYTIANRASFMRLATAPSQGES